VLKFVHRLGIAQVKDKIEKSLSRADVYGNDSRNGEWRDTLRGEKSEVVGEAEVWGGRMKVRKSVAMKK